jgi:outer membrane protein
MISSRVWLLAAVATAGLASQAVDAQGNLKIGVINLDRVVEGSPGYAAARKKIDDEFGPRQRDLEALAQKLRTQQETFQRDAPVMGAEEKATLERQLRDGARDFERQRNELAEDFQLRQNEEIANLRRDAVMRAQQYAREQKFDLLLLDQTVVFASTAVDITEAVIGKPAAAAPARGQ